MKIRHVEFSLLSFSYWYDMLDFSFCNVSIDDWNRSLFQIGKDLDRWYIDILFMRLKS